MVAFVCSIDETIISWFQTLRYPTTGLRLLTDTGSNERQIRRVWKLLRYPVNFRFIK